MTRAQANNPGRNDKRLRATQPNDPNAAFTNRRGNGTDRIFESSMHDASFTSRMLKSPPALWKVKAQAKAEMKAVKPSLNLDLDLSLPRSLRPCWTDFLSILRGILPLFQTGRSVKYWPA
jgi:hypothetical protein